MNTVTQTDEKQKTVKYFKVAPHVWGMKEIFVNVFMIYNPEKDSWVLVDAGLKTSIMNIRKMAHDLFGDRHPAAIILTHGHFDHVGALEELANEWEVPVFAHYLEFPYLNGKSQYPPADPTTGGGMMSWMSFMYPRGPVNITENLVRLPDNGEIPVLPGWKFIHTPGHSPGHISLFREKDRLLIAGDAIVTTQAESVISVMLDREEVCGPPVYFTINWPAAERSVKKLAALRPNILVSGHGKPLQGAQMQRDLQELADNFNAYAIPSSGRYVEKAAYADEDGVKFIPPSGIPVKMILSAVSVVAAVAGIVVLLQNRKKKTLKSIFQ